MITGRHSFQRKLGLGVGLTVLSSARLLAGDPAPLKTISPDNNTYHSPIQIGTNPFFPSSSYGANHNGSSFTLTPGTSLFFPGNTDSSKGILTYYCAPFTPRNSEGVFEMDVWLEKEQPDGSWIVVDNSPNLSSNPGNGTTKKTATPNPGPGNAETYTWTFNHFNPSEHYRVFVYVYIWNQGGGGQGDYPIYSWTNTIDTLAANDAPRIAFTSSTGTGQGAVNPSTMAVGQPYVISADAEDDNGNLLFVDIYKDGQPFALNTVSGATGNSQNSTSDNTPGTVTYTAQAKDTLGATSPLATWTVTILPKTDQQGVSSQDESILLGQSFTPGYLGGSGGGNWQFVVGGLTNWDTSSGNVGTLLPSGAWASSWTPPVAGTYAFYVWHNGDASYNPSPTTGPYTLTVYGAPNVTWVNTPASQVASGTTLNWSAAATSPNGIPLSAVQLHFDLSTDGGNTWTPWSYQYASNQNSNPVAAGAPGTTYTMRATVNDGTPGSNGFVGAIYSSVTVVANGQVVSISPSAPSVAAGGSITFTASGGQNGYVWSGSASGGGTTQIVTFNAPGSYFVTVYSPGGGAYSQSNTATATVTVNAATQIVAISPANPAVNAGSSVTFTASGGQNGYVWSGSASGSGSTQTVTFNTPGSYNVTAYSPSGGIYGQSNTATTAITVNAVGQTVAISPTNQTIFAGATITFNASGGQNGYVWGGSASGGGAAQSVTFNTPGTYSVTVYSPLGGTYAQSNTATAIITVNSPAPTATISASPTSGIAPLTTTIAWATTTATTVVVSGQNLSSSATSGSQSVTLGAGTYTYSITVSGPGGSASNTLTVTVAANTATLSTASSTVNFGSIFRDSLAGSPTTATRTIVFSNPGNGPLTLTALSASGSPFSITAGLTLPFTLAPGASASITVMFGPGAPMGSSSGTLIATASSNTATVALSGISLAPKIQIIWK